MEAKFVGFSVEDAAASGLGHLGAARVIVWSERPFRLNAVVHAWVGDEEVDAISVDQFGLSFEGFLAEAPDAADTLSVQIDGGERVDTGLTAEEEPPNA